MDYKDVTDEAVLRKAFIKMASWTEDMLLKHPNPRFDEFSKTSIKNALIENDVKQDVVAVDPIVDKG